MDPEGWIAVVSAVVALTAVPAAYLSARHGRSQAESARKGVEADTRSSYAAWSAARIAKETFDREDRPEFESSVEHGAPGVIGVTLKAVTGPARIMVDAVWTSNCSWPDGIARGGRMFFERGPTALEVRRGEPFGFAVTIDKRADQGTIILDLFCRDATGDDRGWECPVVLDWDQRPPNLWT